MAELIGMCHRILVLKEGRIAGEFDRNTASQERIMHAATEGGDELTNLEKIPGVGRSRSWRPRALTQPVTQDFPQQSFRRSMLKAFARRPPGQLHGG
jgi:hypothetical protein